LDLRQLANPLEGDVIVTAAAESALGFNSKHLASLNDFDRVNRGR
jgi:hypothetical protein